jgi:hypothetical protein
LINVTVDTVPRRHSEEPPLEAAETLEIEDKERDTLAVFETSTAAPQEGITSLPNEGRVILPVVKPLMIESKIVKDSAESIARKAAGVIDV